MSRLADQSDMRLRLVIRSTCASKVGTRLRWVNAQAHTLPPLGMTLGRVQSRSLLGIDAPPVEVEVHVANGLPAVTIVGLPEAAVRESRDRVRAAITNSGFDFPNRRLTINLAPADLPKDSGRFDLAIAIGVLIATEQVPSDRLADRLFVGELSLSGDTREVRGAMALALAIARPDFALTSGGQVPPSAQTTQATLVLPVSCATEAAVVPGIRILGAASLAEVVADLRGEDPLKTVLSPETVSKPDTQVLEMADIRGQHQLKAGLEVAAAGGHNILLIGPPGGGKSMLAQRLPGILPALSDTEALETGAVASLAGRFKVDQWRYRPFRAPHHSASTAALVGGGPRIRPGEISLAHNGVLFLDELPEFGARTLDSLREPIETGSISLSRAAHRLELPARFQLIAAMNPCPCGHFGGSRCRCTPDQVARYQQRVSGPLLDRIDLQLWVTPVQNTELLEKETAETSADISQRVMSARRRQLDRQGCTNAALTPNGVTQHCGLTSDAATLLTQTAKRLHWSARVFHRIQKLARTAADLTGEADITPNHVAQAISYRRALGLLANRAN